MRWTAAKQRKQTDSASYQKALNQPEIMKSHARNQARVDLDQSELYDGRLVQKLSEALVPKGGAETVQSVQSDEEAADKEVADHFASDNFAVSGRQMLHVRFNTMYNNQNQEVQVQKITGIPSIRSESPRSNKSREKAERVELGSLSLGLQAKMSGQGGDEQTCFVDQEGEQEPSDQRV